MRTTDELERLARSELWDIHLATAITALDEAQRGTTESLTDADLVSLARSECDASA